jgi:uncharacterized membrane protein YdjX (TVP38/TMEM64 family)
VTNVLSRNRILILVALAVTTAIVLLTGPARATVAALLEWAREAGPIGLLVPAVAYLVAAALFLPVWPITMAVGFASGPLLGFAVAWPSSAVAGAIAFLVGRTVGRGPVSRAIAASPRLRALEDSIARQGFQTVVLLRLSPLFPYNLVNYALGTTRLRLRDFTLASAVGMVPSTLLYAYLGSLAASAADAAAGRTPPAGPASRALYWGGLAVATVATFLVTRAARRALGRPTPDAPDAGPARDRAA